MNPSQASRDREDISQFVVHLTRDDQKDFSTGGATARKNFLRILRERRIGAFRAHCIFNPLLGKAPSDVQEKFRVACFTETPLNQLHLLARNIPGRSVILEPFGFCFRKSFLVEAGSQQAVYINSYGGNGWLKDSVMALYKRFVTTEELEEPEWRILPFLNAMHEKYDFSWEREWRVRGDLKFKLADLVCVILPNEGEEDLKAGFADAGIAAISPGWRYEDIVGELAKQQRATKAASKAIKSIEAQA